MTDSYTFNTPIGFLTIREEEKKLTKLFWEANSVQTMKNELHSDFLYEVYTQVNEYLTGRRKQFDVPLKYQGSQFQQSVWQELQKIPYGETRSYQEIAAVIGNEKAVRAVGQANNKNPILLIFPNVQSAYSSTADPVSALHFHNAKERKQHTLLCITALD